MALVPLSSYGRRVAAAAVGSNAVGAAVTVVFGVFLVPPPSGGIEPDPERNLVVVAIYTVLCAAISGTLTYRALRPGEEWLLAGAEGPPPPVVRRSPLLVLRACAFPWAGAVVVFSVLNALDDPELVLGTAIIVVIGGLTSCLLAFLLSEHALRPATVRALAAVERPEPSRPGVEARVRLTWALGTAAPVLGIALIALRTVIDSDADAQTVAVAAGVLALLALAVGGVAMRLVARSLASSIQALRVALERVTSGDFDARVEVENATEVGVLQSGFNAMTAGLRERERLRDLHERQVGREVAREALERGAELGGSEQDAGVLFVDLEGSTQLAATRPPQEVVELLNGFFAAVVEEAERHGGWVNKFLGDAALCVFGPPDETDEAATRALACARDLCRRLAEEVPVAAQVGVSAGPVVAGNVGATSRFEYTVVGDPVNEAARLVELAKERGVPLLVAHRAVEAAHPDEAAHWQAGDSAQLRGRTGPTRLATPVGAPAPRPAGGAHRA